MSCDTIVPFLCLGHGYTQGMPETFEACRDAILTGNVGDPRTGWSTTEAGRTPMPRRFLVIMDEF